MTEKKRIKCVACYNFVDVVPSSDGSYTLVCPYCRAVVYSRKQNPKTTIIRIKQK